MFENEGHAGQSKSERTRERIRVAAIELFIERGYAETSMRQIAARADVSVGNAYYYFPSKDHLVQALYLHVQRDHVARAEAGLAESNDLIARVRTVFLAGLDALAPYRAMASGFLSAMIPPNSPINPLNAASASARDVTTTLFRTAVDGAQHKLPRDVATLLPDALFRAHLGLVLRWTYDQTPEQRATRELLTTTISLVARAVPLVRVPGIHGPVRSLVRQLAEVTA